MGELATVTEARPQEMVTGLLCVIERVQVTRKAVML